MSIAISTIYTICRNRCVKWHEILSAIVSMAGDSLVHLKNEIDKISLSLDDPSEINQIDITKFSGWKRKYRQFEFYTLILKKKCKKLSVWFAMNPDLCLLT